MEKKKKINSYFILFLSLSLILIYNSSYVFPLIISEVYAKDKSCDNEYIEIYSNETINLSLLEVGDQDKVSKVNCENCSTSGFIVIVGQSFNQTLNVSFCRLESNCIGKNGLKDSGEEVVVIYNGTNHTLNYSSFSQIENKSYSFFQGSYRFCERSPGKENCAEINQSATEPTQMQEELQIEYPKNVISLVPFVVRINLSEGKEVKVDIFDKEGERICEKKENGKWKSCYYYSTFDQNAIFELRVNVNYSGYAFMNVSLRNGSKVEKFGPYKIFVYPNYEIKEENEEKNDENKSREESYLKILECMWNNDSIYFEIEAYRGDTRKYAIYLYGECNDRRISEKKKWYLEKYEKKSIEGLLKLNRECEKIWLILEGLEEKDECFIKKNEEKKEKKEKEEENEKESKEKRENEKENERNKEDEFLSGKFSKIRKNYFEEKLFTLLLLFISAVLAIISYLLFFKD